MARFIAIWVADASPVQGALVSFGGATSVTNADGWCSLNIEGTAGILTITKSGYEDYSAAVTLLPATRDISVGPIPQTSQDAITLPPLQRRALPRLSIINRQFFTPDNSAFLYTGFSAFALFKKWLDGGSAAIESTLADIQGLLAEVKYPWSPVLRVFRYAAPPNTFAVTPFQNGYLDAIAALTDYLGSRGFYIDWTAGDSDQLGLDAAWRRSHMTDVFNTLQGKSNVFLQELNEPFKNGGLSGWRPPSAAVLCSSGDYEPASLHSNMFHFVDDHGVRDDGSDYPKFLYDPICQMYEGWGGFDAVTAPIIEGEPKGFGPGPGRCNDPRKAFLKGIASATWLAGATFHSNNGINADPLDAPTRACARMFLQGMLAPSLGLAR